MVGFELSLGEWRSNNGGERKSTGLFFHEMNVGEEVVTVGEGQNGYLYPSGPTVRLSAALNPRQCRSPKTVNYDLKFCWLFWVSGVMKLRLV